MTPPPKSLLRHWLHATLVVLVLLFSLAPSEEAAIDAPDEESFVQVDDMSDDRTDSANEASAPGTPRTGRKAVRATGSRVPETPAALGGDAPFRPPKAA